MNRIQGQINARALLAGSTSQDFSAKALTLSGEITGATSGAFTTHIDIGNARIMWDSANNAIKIINKNLTDTVNFYTTGSSAALGIGVGGGGTAYDRLTLGFLHSGKLDGYYQQPCYDFMAGRHAESILRTLRGVQEVVTPHWL
jgi:hypothetical protein